MSPKLPSLTAREIIKLAEQQGFHKVRQKWSHAGKTIGSGLLLQILSDIGIDPADLRN